jgi:UDP-galactopyranose mutase
LGLSEEYDLVIVGSGLSGAVIAEQASSRLGLRSLVIDKRDHIAGNCYDYIDRHGIRISQYGVHIFHTKYPRVEQWVTKFSKWVPYKHRVLGQVAIR